jgi:hypothetical protein
METNSALRLMEDLVRRMSTLSAQRALILASPGFLIPDNYRSVETDLMEHAVRANVIVST